MSIITEKKSISAEDLSTLRDIQEKTQTLVFALGEIEVMRIQLDERYEQSRAHLIELTQRENAFNTLLANKYGDIELNPTTGEFTVSN
jgi:hypothetical protein